MALLLWILGFLSAESQLVNDLASLPEEDEVTQYAALESPAGSPGHNEKMCIVPRDPIAFYPEMQLMEMDRLPRTKKSLARQCLLSLSRIKSYWFIP